jgi:carboxymethylenebutenolidase
VTSLRTVLKSDQGAGFMPERPNNRPEARIGREDFMSLEKVWAAHLAAEFGTKDVEATLETMVDDAYVNHVPVNTGGRGKDELRRFYRDIFIPSWPEDLQMTQIGRVIGDSGLVDELRLAFTHTRRMDWFLPGVEPTNARIEIDIVVVVEFRGDKLSSERIYWDHATVLRQVGMPTSSQG